MTSFAFILGVAPLVVSTGAGGEMRQSLGTPCLPACLALQRSDCCLRPCSTSSFVRILPERRRWPKPLVYPIKKIACNAGRPLQAFILISVSWPLFYSAARRVARIRSPLYHAAEMR
jgi:hypothetical protein